MTGKPRVYCERGIIMLREISGVGSFSPEEIKKQDSFRTFLNQLKMGARNSPYSWESKALDRIAEIKEEAFVSYGTKAFDNAYESGNNVKKAVYNEVVREQLQYADKNELKEIVSDPECSTVQRKWAKTLLDTAEDDSYKGKSIFSAIEQGGNRETEYNREYYRQHPEELLEASRNPEYFYSPSMDLEERKNIDRICQEIQDNLWKDDDYIPGSGELFPEYRELMETGGYMDVEEMCNAECLNISDAYDFEPKRYSDEFKRGFIDFVRDGSPSPLDTDVIEMQNAAYVAGLDAAYSLVDYI